MLQEYKTKTNIGIGLGLLLSLGGRMLLAGGEQQLNLLAGLVLTIAGAIAFIWGCMSYARGKGYSPLFGLLGLLYILGLIILALMPDKHKSTS